MDADGLSPPPKWWVPPGDIDVYAWISLGFFFFFVFVLIYLYSVFDRYAEHKSAATPLKTTVPTLLVIAFAYEVFPPLSHFSILLPLALIAAALARDLMLWFTPDHEGKLHHD